MTFGEDWGWGADAETCRRIFECFAGAGGNFIDTSGNYTNGTSERLVGEFIQNERDRFVVATKYTLRLATGNGLDANQGGNSRKTMQRSVEESLRRMKTDYIDLLYLHMWDEMTPVEEVLRAADDLVRAGKLLYFAFSDTPAWVVSHAIARAEDSGWTRPCAVQFPYSLLSRSVENDVLPMARAFGLAMLAWGLLEDGTLTGKYSRPAAEPRREEQAGERLVAAGEAVARLAGEIGRSPAQVAIDWVRQQPGNMIPILGCRSVWQIEDNLGCLDFHLSDEQMERLNDISGFRPGFPMSFLHSKHVRGLIFGDFYEKIDRV
jgi:aryl-alcohol dehydrogenase-like predicted oxidoreductase